MSKFQTTRIKSSHFDVFLLKFLFNKFITAFKMLNLMFYFMYVCDPKTLKIVLSPLAILLQRKMCAMLTGVPARCYILTELFVQSRDIEVAFFCFQRANELIFPSCFCRFL